MLGLRGGWRAGARVEPPARQQREAVPESLLAFGLDVAAVLPGRFGR